MSVSLINTLTHLPLIAPSPHAEILSHDLQAGAEDEQDYQAPEEGNLLYKLYSLQDLLLLVRSSVSLTHSRQVGSQNQVHVLVYTRPPEFHRTLGSGRCLEFAFHTWRMQQVILRSDAFTTTQTCCSDEGWHRRTWLINSGQEMVCVCL